MCGYFIFMHSAGMHHLVNYLFGKPFPRYHFKGFAVRRLCGLHCFAVHAGVYALGKLFTGFVALGTGFGL
ncbi:MAG: hypothetical protein NTX45_02435 [Proteobacteria bacterium]|nr:hypothetical protein [Pseudomonadota bacterium]